MKISSFRKSRIIQAQNTKISYHKENDRKERVQALYWKSFFTPHRFFTSVADGQWNAGETWGHKGNEESVDYPGPEDQAIIESAKVTLDTDQISGMILILPTGVLDCKSFNLTIRGWFKQAGGVFRAPSSTLTVAGAFNRIGGDFIHSSGTVKFLANNSYTITCGGATLYNVVFDKEQNKEETTLDFGDGFNIAGNLTLKKKESLFATGCYNVKAVEGKSPVITVFGDLGFPDTPRITPIPSENAIIFGTGNSSHNFTVHLGGNFYLINSNAMVAANIVLNGNGDQSIDNSKGRTPAGKWVIDKASGTVTLMSNLDLHTAAAHMEIRRGILCTNSYNLLVGGFFVNRGILRVRGNEMLPIIRQNQGEGRIEYLNSATGK